MARHLAARLAGVAGAVVLLTPPTMADVEGRPPVPLVNEAALETQGLRIGTVTVRVRDIFDTSDPREDAALFRLANALHVSTHEETLRAQLLFATGDRYSRRRVQETARRLRTLRYVHEPEIRVTRVHDGLVDLEVSARDVWTTNPGVSFGRSGGANSSGIELEDLNVLGYGKQLELELASGIDRDTRSIRWIDPAIRGSRWRGEIGLADGSDGKGYRLDIERPFFSLDSRWSAGFAVESESGFDHRYSLGHIVDGYERDRRFAELRFGWSPGVADRWTRRWTAGLRHESSDFGPALAGSAPSAWEAPTDRSRSYPWLRFEAIEDDFEVVRNHDQIARTEDMAFGQHYLLELGAAADAMLVRGSAGRGLHLGADRSLLLSLEAAGWVEEGRARDALLSARARYYQPTSPRTLLFAALEVDQGHALDGDHELVLGGEDGLRGYPLRYQRGSGRALLTLEERLYTHWSLWRLAHIGAAAFADIGTIWGDSSIAAPRLGSLADVGFGLRLGNTRSGLGNVLHLDVAWPLGGDPSVSGMQFLVQTKHSF